MGNVMRIVAVVLVGIVSVGFSEFCMMNLMDLAPMELTNNYFWKVILPIELVVVGLATALLYRIHKRMPQWSMPVYVVTFACTHAAELNMLLNPTEDILAYVMGIFLASAIWFSVFWIAVFKPARTSVA